MKQDPSGLVYLPPDSVRVEDEHEEIFLLYTQLSASGAQDGSCAFTGLGSVNSKNDMLEVQFELPPTESSPGVTAASSKRRGRRNQSRGNPGRTLDIELLQDKTTLRSRKGDTGSVLWRVSQPLFNRERLRKSSVLELGAGTGLMSLVLSSWVEHYTASDLDYLVPLIRKNLAINIPSVQHSLKTYQPAACKVRTNSLKCAASGVSCDEVHEPIVTVEPLDWLQLHSAPPRKRQTLHRLTHGQDPPDLVLSLDCIYNPSLLAPLVCALDRYTAAARTCVIVVAELRAPDVMREFLAHWLSLGGWEIWRIGRHGIQSKTAQDGSLLGASFVAWIGWRNSNITATDANLAKTGR